MLKYWTGAMLVPVMGSNQRALLWEELDEVAAVPH
jgi:hypothetical protein